MGFEHAIRASQGARSYQEDAAAVRQDGGGLIAVLADGMGGHAGGAVASGVATASFLEGYLAAEGDAEARLAEALGRANAAIRREAATRPALRGMGCTLLGVAFAATGSSPSLSPRAFRSPSPRACRSPPPSPSTRACRRRRSR